MLSQYVSQNAVDIGIAGNLSSDTIAWSLNELLHQCLNILQIPDFPDPEDREVVPPVAVAILRMVCDPSQEASGYPDGVEAARGETSGQIAK